MKDIEKTSLSDDEANGIQEIGESIFWSLVDDLLYYHQHPSRINNPVNQKEKQGDHENYYECMKQYYEDDWVGCYLKKLMHFNEETGKAEKLDREMFLKLYFKSRDESKEKNKIRNSKNKTINIKINPVKTMHENKNKSGFLIDQLYEKYGKKKRCKKEMNQVLEFGNDYEMVATW